MAKFPRTLVSRHEVSLALLPSLVGVKLYLQGQNYEGTIVYVEATASFVKRGGNDPLIIDVPIAEAQAAWDKNPDLWFLTPSIRTALEPYGEVNELSMLPLPEIKPFAVPEPQITRNGWEE